MKNSTSTQKENPSEPTNLAKANDPIILLYLYIFNQAVMDITAFYSGTGTLEARLSGKKAIGWIKNCEGTFPMVAYAATTVVPNIDEVKFHQWSLELIYEIKQSCIRNKASRIRTIDNLWNK